MAEGAIRIVRNGTEESVGQTGQLDISDSEFVVSANNGKRQAASNSGSDRRRNAQTKRAALSVENRGNEDQSEVASSADPKRTTPSPHSERQTRKSVPSRGIYMSRDEAKVTADYLLAAVEMVGVLTSGPAGEMSPFERGILQPPLTRIVSRTPLHVVERVSPIIDLAAITVGMGMYLMRITSGITLKGKTPQPQVQEDVRAPVAAQPQNVVRNVQAGDVDGIAAPVPDIIRQHINGSI